MLEVSSAVQDALFAAAGFLACVGLGAVLILPASLTNEYNSEVRE